MVGKGETFGGASGTLMPPLRFTWRALQRVEADLGKDWLTSMEDALQAIDTPTLSIIIAATFIAPDPRADPAYWMDLSPPVNEAKRAIERGFMQAIEGPQQDQEPTTENPMKPTSLPVRMWRRLVGHGADMADHPQISTT